MSYNEFKFVIVEIPHVITLDHIAILHDAVSSLSINDAITINKIIDIDISKVSIETIDEDELFQIGEDSLKVRYVIKALLNEAVDILLAPKVSMGSRIGTPIGRGDFSYIRIDDKSYVISGYQSGGYYGFKKSEAYNCLIAINLSGILNNITD